MKLRLMLGLAGLFLALAGARAVDPKQRSDSASQQFSIYCEDVRLRHRVVSFVEEVKTDVLQLMGVADRWKAPIVVTIEKQTWATTLALPQCSGSWKLRQGQKSPSKSGSATIPPR